MAEPGQDTPEMADCDRTAGVFLTRDPVRRRILYGDAVRRRVTTK
jgi:hypothetical protein